MVKEVVCTVGKMQGYRIWWLFNPLHLCQVNCDCRGVSFGVPQNLHNSSQGQMTDLSLQQFWCLLTWTSGKPTPLQIKKPTQWHKIGFQDESEWLQDASRAIMTIVEYNRNRAKVFHRGGQLVCLMASHHESNHRFKSKSTSDAHVMNLEQSWMQEWVVLLGQQQYKPTRETIQPKSPCWESSSSNCISNPPEDIKGRCSQQILLFLN